MTADLWQLAGLFLLALLSEDAAVIAGAFLAAMEPHLAPAAFLACFLGIWLGDLGLYFLARQFGRPLVNRLWNRNDALSAKIVRSESWFRHHGLLTLVMCRIVPGTRLPGYLAAGFLRMPGTPFAAATGLLAGLWVALVFQLVHLAGKAAPELLHAIHRHGWWVGACLAAVLGILAFRRQFLAAISNSPWLRR